ncbi:MAG: hypothetical protein ACRD1X_17945 [Vicinamibacteria bacterium]
MLQPDGVWILRDRDSGKETHSDFIVCAHCNNMYDVPDGTTPQYFCPKCGTSLCKNCFDEFRTGPHGCIPYMKKIEAAEEAQYRRQRFMRMAGID